MLKVGDLVDVKNRGLGTIENIVNSSIADLNVYIVQLKETRDLLKCLEEDLSPVKKKDTITISKNDFISAIKNIDMEPILNTINNPLVASTVSNVLVDFVNALHRELFEKKAEND